MSRPILFSAVLLGGTLLLETFWSLGREVALLVAWVTASVLVFCLPVAGKKLDVHGLIFSLLVMVGTYVRFFKFRPWFAAQVGQPLGVVVSILLVFAFGER
jgi:hypothetical protein